MPTPAVRRRSAGQLPAAAPGTRNRMYAGVHALRRSAIAVGCAFHAGYAIATGPSRQAITRRQAGEATLELALCLLLLIPLILGMADCAQLLRGRVLAENAANAGCAYGAQGLPYAQNQAGIAAAARAESSTAGCTGGLQVTSRTGSDGTASWVAVETRCQVDGLLLLSHLGTSATVAGHAQRRVLPW
jgi:Flp pilus assembly protein TadG